MRRCLALALFLCCANAFAGEYLVYFGTYTGPKSQGIYVSKFDAATGVLAQPELAAAIRNPSFLALAPDEKHLYAAGELTSGGAVTGFSINRETGRLTKINQENSGGSGPCHLSLDATGKCVLVANYGSGSIASLPIKADGTLGAPASVIQHTGSSVNADRQAGPHAHFICPSPDNRFVLVCDLGLDKVLAYKLNSGNATLAPADPPFVKIAPGSGPRHLVFSADRKFVYVISEMGGSITTLSYDLKTAAMKTLPPISTLPATFTGNNTSAEIAIHPSGKFLYVSNRGHDSLALFNVDRASGKLTLVEHQTAELHMPRHFAIDPTGHWLIAENQSTDSVVVFAIDPKSGRLKSTAQKISIGSPVCSVFLPL